MKKGLLQLSFMTLLLGVGYNQCNESNWLWHYNSEGHNMAECYLEEAYLAGANLEGACLEGSIAFTQTDYIGVPTLEGCALSGGDCSFEDIDQDGYDDESYIAGAQSGDTNLDAILNGE